MTKDKPVLQHGLDPSGSGEHPPGLLHGGPDGERTEGSGLPASARGNIPDGSGCYEADAGDTTEAAREDDRFKTEFDKEITKEMSRAGAAIIADFYDQPIDWTAEWKARQIYSVMRALLRSKTDI